MDCNMCKVVESTMRNKWRYLTNDDLKEYVICKTKIGGNR